MWFLRLELKDVIDIVDHILRGLFANLCKILYPWIANLYDIFKEIGMLFYNEQFKTIYNRISLIIGIFMVFRITFWLIESLINPDLTNDKEKNPGKIIQKVLVAVVLLAITPTIFEYAFNIQNKIMSSNIIENIVGIDEVTSEDTTVGRNLSANLFINFYTPTIVEKDGVELPPYSHDCVNMYTVISKEEKGGHYDTLYNYGHLNYLDNYCLTETHDINGDGKKEFIIDFNGLFATGVAIFVCWILLMYCISLGTRYVQLIYLQVIAPIPIMCYLTPSKDNMFSKWIKQCTTTYLDLFIRVAIINFAMFLCSMLLSNENNIIKTIGDTEPSTWAILFLVLGLLTFAKKAPDLVQELLPKSMSTKASGDFGLSLKKRTDAMLGGKFAYSTLKRAPGYVAGGLGGAIVGGAIRASGATGIGGKFRGAVAGAFSGFAAGSKKGNVIKNLGDVKKNQASYNSKLQQWRIAAGKGDDEPDTIADSIARRTEGFKKSLGFETKAAELKRDTEFANQAADSYKSIIDFGAGKALEKNKSLKAFGMERGIAELDAMQKSAAAEYQNATVENLLTTDEGNLKLKNISRKLKFEELKASGKSEAEAEVEATEYFNNYDNKTEAEKVKDAEAAIEYLRRESINAAQIYEDSKKEAGFIHLVEEFALGQDQNIKNEFKVMNEFLKSHPEIAEQFGLKQPIPGKEYFDAEEMENLRINAVNNVPGARDDFEKLFKSFDKFKTLKSIYVAKNTETEALRNKANDQYSGK